MDKKHREKAKSTWESQECEWQSSITTGRVPVPSLPLSALTTQPTFIEWQNIIHRSLPTLKILGQKNQKQPKGDYEPPITKNMTVINLKKSK